MVTPILLPSKGILVSRHAQPTKINGGSGLSTALSDTDEIEMVTACVNGQDALAEIERLAPDVVLLDLQMPVVSGLEVLRTLQHGTHGPAALVLTMFETDESLFAAMRAGARGYLIKGTGEDDIRRAIIAVAAGEVIFGAGVASAALAFFSAAPAGGRAARAFPALTDRELEILTLVASGRTNPEIAAALMLSDKTVRNHVSNVFAKLQVTHRSQAIVVAREAGLSPDPPA